MNLVRDLGQRGPAANEDSRSEMILNCMPYAIRQAVRFAAMYSLDRDDCIQQAALGLCHGVDQYDHGRGVKPITYLSHWAFAYLQMLLRNKHYRERGRVQSLDALAACGDAVPDWLEALGHCDPEYAELSPGAEAMVEIERLIVLADLNPREEQMIRELARGIRPIDVAKQHGVSRERVRQITEAARQKMRKAAS